MYTVQNLLTEHNIRLVQPSDNAAEIADRLISNQYTEYDPLEEYVQRIRDARYLMDRGESWAELYQYPGYLSGNQFPEAFEALEKAAIYFSAHGFPPQNSRGYSYFNTMADILTVGGSEAFHRSGELIAQPEARRALTQLATLLFDTFVSVEPEQVVPMKNNVGDQMVPVNSQSPFCLN
jgi:hypothetical protein